MTDWDKRVQIAADKHAQEYQRSDKYLSHKSPYRHVAAGFIAGATYEREQLGKFGDAALKCEVLQAQADALESALEDAFESIHSEYCGRTHHPVCDLPRNALAAYAKFKERGE